MDARYRIRPGWTGAVQVKRASLLLIVLLAACGGGGSGTPASLVPVTPDVAARAPRPHAKPRSIAFDSAASRKFTVTESNYHRAFSESTTCNPLDGEIAVVARTSSTPGSVTYTVTPQSAGTCTISISDVTGRAVKVSVKVTTAAITVH